MRLHLVLLLVLLFSHTTLADQNPDVRVYLDFDPPNGVSRIDPEPNSPLNVYVVIDCFGSDGGLRGVILSFERTFGGFCGGEVNLLGGIDPGNVEDPVHGWLAGGGSECVYPDENGIVVAGYVQYWYTGPPGYIQVTRPEDEDASPAATLDCDLYWDYWCVAGNAGVCVDPPQGEPGCECGPTAVERSSWGSVKALYR